MANIVDFTGPPPKPTKIKRMEGNRGRKKLNSREPQPDELEAKAAPPSYLTANAKRVWRVWAPKLAKWGMLTAADEMMFAAFCQSVATWREFSKKAARRPKNQYDQVSAEVTIAKQALKEIVQLGTHFGLSPAVRSRLNKDFSKPEDDEASMARNLFGDE